MEEDYVEEPQPGSQEWLRIEDEKRPFGMMPNGRSLTTVEEAEHEKNLQTIRAARHAV
jgi:hypothetical protein